MTTKIEKLDHVKHPDTFALVLNFPDRINGQRERRYFFHENELSILKHQIAEAIADNRGKDKLPKTN